MNTNRPTLPGHSWVCHTCDFMCGPKADAMTHAEATEHWLWEHPYGNTALPAKRELHSSDAGGCYVALLIGGAHVHPAGPTEAAWLKTLK